MLVFTSEAELKAYRDNHPDIKIGFVPTMGALHEGHLQLVDRAKKENDVVIVSVFVNPSQFNNKSDLLKYPRNIERDKELLKSRNCDIVFVPSEKEVYPEGYQVTDLDLGSLELVMEGKYRPGHFKGVVMVVKRLFEMVQPDKAYFGLKDFQQVAVIRALNEKFNLVRELVPCETIREESGLAMSSRNELLNKEQKEEAAVLFRTLKNAREMAKKGKTPAEIIEKSLKKIRSTSLKPEYFEIVDERTLAPLDSFSDTKPAIACVAAWTGSVRLIDNLPIFP